MLRREIWLLVMKELRQLTRNRNAAISAVLMPLIFLIVVPLIQISAAGSEPSGSGIRGTPLAGLNSIANTDQVFLYLVFPLFYTLCGLLTPGISATYTIVAEREQHTVELLMALPVTVRQILIAKLTSNLVSAAAISLPFFAINAFMVQTRADAGAAYILSALVLLLCGLACSVGIGLLLALLARDVRTAGNLTPLWLFPTMALTGLVVVLVPGLWRFYVLGAILLLGLGITLTICLRWLTFERFVA